MYVQCGDETRENRSKRNKMRQGIKLLIIATRQFQNPVFMPVFGDNSLFEFDRCRRFGGEVVEDAVNTFDLIDDPI